LSDILLSELDCVPRCPDTPVWGDSPFLSSSSRPEASDSLPSLMPVSSSGEWSLSGWGPKLGYPENVDRSMWVRMLEDVEGFERDLDQSSVLEGVEGDVGGGLLEFVDDVVVHRDEGLGFGSQVAVRSGGPPSLAGTSEGNPICVE
jgi:hypothetical protein